MSYFLTVSIPASPPPRPSLSCSPLSRSPLSDVITTWTRYEHRAEPLGRAGETLPLPRDRRRDAFHRLKFSQVYFLVLRCKDILLLNYCTAVLLCSLISLLYYFTTVHYFITVYLRYCAAWLVFFTTLLLHITLLLYISVTTKLLYYSTTVLLDYCTWLSPMVVSS